MLKMISPNINSLTRRNGNIEWLREKRSIAYSIYALYIKIINSIDAYGRENATCRIVICDKHIIPRAVVNLLDHQVIFSAHVPLRHGNFGR